jgi:rare lipoprotein A
MRLFKAMIVSMLLMQPLILQAHKYHETDLGIGGASYYNNEFAGRRTASGEAFDPKDLTAAHRTAPFGSHIRVTNLGNGMEVIVRVNDRGPWSGARIIDLSYAAAKQIGMHRSGTAKVKLTLVTS